MILNKIVENKKKKLIEIKKNKDFSRVKSDGIALAEFDRFKFNSTIKRINNISFICEIKKASPSKGIISENFDHRSLIVEYEEASADALSILTETDFFMGSDNYLIDAKKITNIPLLRKDFIIDEYQIYESKTIGADAILLIVSLLERVQLSDYLKIADELGLSVLVETRNKKEIDIALEADAKIIGVNNRDLMDFSVNISNGLKLKEFVPDDKIFVAESGFRSREDVIMYEKAGADAILIGEHLMKSDDKFEFLSRLRGDK
ncbi:MAG: indole-3-glycerol phosphate synthase TrpC [Christensenellaceae bacterium]|nr:indole-3-glycerol phosphate synthase TrpC [Christensenellaceae bacterium]